MRQELIDVNKGSGIAQLGYMNSRSWSQSSHLEHSDNFKAGEKVRVGVGLSGEAVVAVMREVGGSRFLPVVLAEGYLTLEFEKFKYWIRPMQVFFCVMQGVLERNCISGGFVLCFQSPKRLVVTLLSRILF